MTIQLDATVINVILAISVIILLAYCIFMRIRLYCSNELQKEYKASAEFWESQAMEYKDMIYTIDLEALKNVQDLRECSQYGIDDEVLYEGKMGKVYLVDEMLAPPIYLLLEDGDRVQVYPKEILLINKFQNK